MSKRSKMDPRWSAAQKAEYRKEVHERKKLRCRQSYAKNKEAIAMKYLKEKLKRDAELNQERIERARGL